MTADKWDSAKGQTHDESELIATDEDVYAWHRWVDNEPDDAVGTHCTAGEIRKLLARLAASEKEREWRGLLVRLMYQDRCLKGRASLDSWNHHSEHGRIWAITKGDKILFHWPKGGDMWLPARPSDEIVAKIKEAVQ